MLWLTTHIFAPMLLGFLVFYVVIIALSILARGVSRLTAAPDKLNAGGKGQHDGKSPGTSV